MAIAIQENLGGGRVTGAARDFADRASRMRKEIADDSGSLAVLVLSLFLILLVSSLAVVDISDNFLAKRQLIEIGEVAITKAAHQISLSRYYSGNIVMDNSLADGAQFRIPLDCTAASSAFLEEIAASNLRGSAIHVESWDCSNDEVSASISAAIPILIKLPFGIGSNQTQITSTIAATSIIGGARG